MLWENQGEKGIGEHSCHRGVQSVLRALQPMLAFPQFAQLIPLGARIHLSPALPSSR